MLFYIYYRLRLSDQHHHRSIGESAWLHVHQQGEETNRHRTLLPVSVLKVMSLTILVSLLLIQQLVTAPTTHQSFVFNGFRDANLSLNGVATVEPGGLLRLTNSTKQSIGHAFYPLPLSFVNTSTGAPLSFSTQFVFAILPQYHDVSANGLALALSPSTSLAGALPSQHLGLFNLTGNGSLENHIIAVELDTVQNTEYKDINDNHVGVDINSLQSVDAAPASYADPGGGFTNLSLISGKPMRLWIDYDGNQMRLNVTLAPINVAKPQIPLLSSRFNLSQFVLDEMYVGFSSATGGVTGLHYILGWSFSLSGKAQELDLSHLPSLPAIRMGTQKHRPHLLILVLAIVGTALVFVVGIGIFIFIKRRKKFAEIREDWEIEYGPHRFSYKDLYKATKGFSDDNILGTGGFGGVYKGVMRKSKLELAVKRVSSESKQGIKEFVAEIVSIGQLRHRNVVQLLGYSRRQGELLLVYDYMPNGSLDKYLFDRPVVSLGWSHRFGIVKGVAAGLLYLHEEWDKVVLHRDIKASNVLLDSDFNGRLGDFGLARLHDHGSQSQTTRLVGTLGYLAPEVSRTGKATTSSDVYAFGAFLLEVACGKRPVELKTSGVDFVLVDWVLDFWKRGAAIEARDRKLGEEYSVEEVELVLKLGLVCSHPMPESRPRMRQVVQFLEGDAPTPELSVDDLQVFDSFSRKSRLFDVSDACHPSESNTVSAQSVSESLSSREEADD